MRRVRTGDGQRFCLARCGESYGREAGPEIPSPGAVGPYEITGAHARFEPGAPNRPPPTPKAIHGTATRNSATIAARPIGAAPRRMRRHMRPVRTKPVASPTTRIAVDTLLWSFDSAPTEGRTASTLTLSAKAPMKAITG